MNGTTIFDLNLNNFLRYFITVLLLVNTFLYTKSYNSLKKVIAFKLLYLYIALSFVLNIITIISSAYKYNNLFLSHFYFIFQLILISAFYIIIFKTIKQRRLVRILFISIITTLAIQYTINPYAYFRFSLLEIFLTSFPLIIYSIIHLYNSLTTKGEYLYVNAAILIYLTATTLIFILGNYLTGIDIDKALARNIWIIHKALNVIFLILFLLEWKNSFSSYKIKAQS